MRRISNRRRNEGADLHYNEPVRRWHPDGDGVRVFTDRGEYTADQIVFSAGAWNPGLFVEAAVAFPFGASGVVLVSAGKQPGAFRTGELS